MLGILLFLLAGSTTRVASKCQNAPCTIDGSFIFTSVADASIQRSVRISRGAAEFDAGGATQWDVDLQAVGFWMPRQSISAGSTKEFPVWRTGTLSGRVIIDPRTKEVLPKQMEIAVEAPPGDPAPIPRDTTFRCPVAADGSWSCDVPATKLDLVVRARTFTPHYRWGTVISPAGTTDLGVLKLRPGASLVAWLDKSTRQRLTSPARALLTRMVMSEPSALTQQLRRPAAQAAFNERGAVQLVDLLPGTYILEIEAKGFAAAHVQPIEIYERSESKLRRPITLEPPLTIRLSISPPLDPSGGVWQVTVSHISEFTAHSGTDWKGNADRDGSLDLPGQSPGKYRVWIKDQRGNRHASRELIVTNDFDAQQRIEIPLTRIQGKVTLGKKPIAAKLLFGGQSGAEQISSTADDDGSFSVTLPREGRWIVDVVEKNLGIFATVDVTVHNGDDDLAIDLPNTEIAGWVAASDGQRVSTARVHLQSKHGVMSREVDPDGTFRFRGMPPGPVTLGARHNRTKEQSRTLAFALSEGSTIDRVELVLDPVHTVSGFVMSEGQPVIGARISAWPYHGGSAERQGAVSDLAGHFELSIPASAAQTDLIIAAAGRTLQAFRMTGEREREQFDLAAAGGQLRLRFARGLTFPQIYFQNIPIPMPDLLMWARAQGAASASGAIEVPNVAPGPYRLCARRKGEDICREGLLARGSLLELTLE